MPPATARKLFLAAGCLAAVSVVFGVAGTVVLFKAAHGAVVERGNERANASDSNAGDRDATTGNDGQADEKPARAGASATPRDGNYTCYVGVGTSAQAAIRKFSIDGNSYEDRSFNQGGGEFDFDPNDGTMTFTSGPFQNHFLGVFVPKGGVLKPSTKYTWGGTDTQPATSDQIHLLDQNTNYAHSYSLGVYCGHDSE